MRTCWHPSPPPRRVATFSSAATPTPPAETKPPTPGGSPRVACCGQGCAARAARAVRLRNWGGCDCAAPSAAATTTFRAPQRTRRCCCNRRSRPHSRPPPALPRRTKAWVTGGRLPARRSRRLPVCCPPSSLPTQPRRGQKAAPRPPLPSAAFSLTASAWAADARWCTARCHLARSWAKAPSCTGCPRPPRAVHGPPVSSRTRWLSADAASPSSFATQTTRCTQRQMTPPPPSSPDRGKRC
mmetsp:Transcript_48923/g.153678  ORF Transcript_48923/g.153678 Transcript_48923/m.153678 type:complete len:241 (+) Transcript_48923:820-1542(+)